MHDYRTASALGKQRPRAPSKGLRADPGQPGSILGSASRKSWGSEAVLVEGNRFSLPVLGVLH